MKKEKIYSYSLYLLIFVALNLLTGNFLLFHAYAEGFSIVIAVLMFVIVWNSKNYIDNNYLYFIGISYLFTANIDFLHVLGYKGMNVFTDYDFYANQLWVAGRFIESLSLLGGFYFLNKSKKLNGLKVIISYFLVSTLLISSIFVWKVFPKCFIEGVGQTTFKITSEIIIILILIFVIIMLRINKNKFNPSVYKSLLMSIILTIFSELFFTIYIDNYGISNIIGHYFKIISFYLVYKSIIEMGIKKTYEVIFNNLENNKKDLEEANKQKTKLFSIVAHDLKNPFNGLVNFSNLLQENYEDMDDNKIKEYIEIIHQSANDLLEMTLNLLEWSKLNIEKKELQFTKVNVYNIFEKILKSFAIVLGEKDIKVDINCPENIFLLGNAYSLEIIFRNLISNAIKYSYQSGTIKINVYEKNQTTSIEIIDNGIGIEKNKIDKLLTATVNKSTSGTQNEKGTGLGLNIVKEYVLMNKGTIFIESNLKEGTKVSLIFNH